MSPGRKPLSNPDPHPGTQHNTTGKTRIAAARPNCIPIMIRVRSWFVVLLPLLLITACEVPEDADTPDAILLDGSFVDLTHPFDDETLYWPTAEPFELETEFAGETDNGFYYEAHRFSASEHGGTHLDAPIHFAEGMDRTGDVSLNRLIAPAVRVDMGPEASADPLYQIQVEDLTAWEDVHGEIEPGDIVLLHTGFSNYWPDAEQYLGTEERGEEAAADLEFPGLHPDAAEWLVENRDIAAIGIDTASIDYGQSADYQTHRHLAKANIPIFENVANTGELPDTGFHVIALPMKIAEGSGGPLRIVAALP